MKLAVALVLLAGLLVTCSESRAATVTLTWTNPSTNTDGSPLTNLTDIIVTYGPCDSTDSYIDGSRGAPADWVIMTSAPGATMSQVETFPAKGDECFVAAAQNSIGNLSAESNVSAWKNPLSTPGQPLPTPGQPIPLSSIIHLTFDHRKS